MNSVIRRSGSLAAGLILVLGAGAPAVADDAELFIATDDPLLTGTQPNIMFIMDTSGSMDNDVVTQVAWDPNVVFDGCYETDGLYFSDTNSPPACGSNNYVNKSVNFCADSGPNLAGLGQYNGMVQAWRGNRDRWVNLNGNQKSRKLECEDDGGVHGDGGAETWAANGTDGPWHTDSGSEPAWNRQYYLFDGNWLNWSTTGGTVTKMRIEVIKEVVTELLDNIDGVNVGLMRFNYEEGGPVLHALEDIDTARPGMKTAIDGLPASGWTPLSETMFEAGQYFMGRNVDYGNVGPVLSVGPSRVGGVGGTAYLAPINEACQKNYIVLLTDGAPTRDVSADSKITSLPDFGTLVSPSCDGSGNGACLDDMADYLFQKDLDGTLAGKQNVTTYTIGFTVDLDLLADTAARGGGEYRLADDTASLAAVLTEIVLSIKDDAATFTAPSVPVNAFNRTQNLNDVFVSVFEPSASVHWPGNLKKYRLVSGELVGQDDQPAVDAQTGFFADSAFSFWSPQADGDQAAEGGAASVLPTWPTRKVYTDINGPGLYDPTNRVETGNADIDMNVLGTPDPGLVDNIIEWLNGRDEFDDDDDGATNDDRNMVGDPFHVQPATVIYGGSADDPDAVVFVNTNDGQMHAVDAKTGVELWTYFPQRMLERAYELYRDEPTAVRRYGLDGDIRVHVLNDDGVPGIQAGERVILVFGMRRGGDGYYAVDVTTRDKPVLLWAVDSNTPGFASMGQTWSTPVVANVKIGADKKAAAIVGGGYDDGQDNSGYREDNIGNALFMIDLLTGDLLWSAGKTTGDLQLPQMTHSIPSPLGVLDANQDGLADRMYVGDMGGRLWRFDILNGNGANSLVEGGVLASVGAADLGGAPPAAEVRRFYNEPDIVPVINDDVLFYAINLGSGYRAHPLDTVIDDEFFSVRDYNAFGVIDTDDYGPPLLKADIVDITFDPNPTLPYNVNGWRLAMIEGAGEKVLSKSFTFQSTVFFTSFTPAAAANACVAASGLNRLYRVDVLDGSPTTNLDDPIDDPDDLTEDDRIQELQQGGIAPKPIFLFPKDRSDEPVVCIGVECIDPGMTNELVRTFWTSDGT